MGKLAFEPAVGTTLSILVLGVLLAALAWWLARGQGNERPAAQSGKDSAAPSPRYGLLNLLRLLGLIILMLGLLRPAYIRTDHLPTAATVAVLLDGSRSMTLKADAKQSRWQVQNEVWKQIGPALREAGELIEPRIFSYAGSLDPLAPESIDKFLGAEPPGESTDVAGALSGVLRESSGRPLAAVILLGDGTQTATTSGPAAVATARSLSALDVPLWTVPIGPRISAGQTRDLALQDLSDQFRVFTKNRFEITATLQARGFAGRALPLRLDLVDASGKRRSLATREATPTQAEQSVPIRIDVNAPEPGSYRLELAADLQEGEVLSDNNRMVAFLDVREGGGRVLYLEGQPTVEQKFLRRAINESDDLQLSFRWIEEPRNGKWQPIDLRDELAGDRYDVIVIGDLPAAAFGDQQLTRIANMVASGKALLMTGGFRSFDPGGYGGTALSQVLPIQMIPNASPGAAGNDRFELVGPLRPQMIVDHPITRLTEAGDSAAQWRRLPPIEGGSKLGPPKQAPGVSVLLADEKKQPLLVVGEFGKGRVAALGLDSTWQWWTKKQSATHRRFWRQMLLWLLARDERKAGQIWVEVDRRRWSSDEAVDFRAGVDDPAQTQLELIAELIPEKGTPQPINVTSGLTGDARTVMGKLQDLPPGFYTLRVSTAAPNIRPGEVTVQVTTSDRELSRPGADLAQLEQLATITAGSGGQAFEPSAAGELATKIRSLKQRAVVPVTQRYRLGDGPISGALLLAALIGVLSTEWALRRKWQLP